MAKCQHCEKKAYYGFVKVIACGDHREEGMIDLYVKRCIFDNCNKIASFGLQTDKKPSYCSAHVEKGMVNIKCKKCLFESCNKSPNFGLQTDNKASYCKSHASEEMINIKSKKCMFDSCNKNSNFGLPYDKKYRYCKSHASEGMIDLSSKKCLVDLCNTRPNYGLPFTKKALYCKTHASKEMIDIKSKICLHYLCRKQPAFGLPFDKNASYCQEHALIGMINIKTKKCLFDSCETVPVFGLPNDTSASYCKEHALENMINIKSKKCKLCKLTHGYIQDYCAPCFYYLNPEHIKTKRHKTRENTFMYQLKEIYPDIILDKAVAGGCSRKRPDGLIDLLTHSIIIEIDEDQHRGYSCENKRSMQLFQDLGSRPIIFIRLNPDSYISNGKKIKGCFTLSKSLGQLIPNDEEISKRFDMLLETIDECKSVPDKELTVIELYFSD